MAEYVGADAASLREQRKDHTTLDRVARGERRAREAGCRQKTYWKRLELLNPVLSGLAFLRPGREPLPRVAPNGWLHERPPIIPTIVPSLV
jgi:hypothetical protein